MTNAYYYRIIKPKQQTVDRTRSTRQSSKHALITLFIFEIPAKAPPSSIRRLYIHIYAQQLTTYAKNVCLYRCFGWPLFLWRLVIASIRQKRFGAPSLYWYQTLTDDCKTSKGDWKKANEGKRKNWSICRWRMKSESSVKQNLFYFLSSHSFESVFYYLLYFAYSTERHITD